MTVNTTARAPNTAMPPIETLSSLPNRLPTVKLLLVLLGLLIPPLVFVSFSVTPAAHSASV